MRWLLPVACGLWLGLLAGGCASPGSTGLRPADVAVYRTPPPRAYEFVATVHTGGPASNRNDALAELREEAARAGGNAVIVSDNGVSTGPLRGIAIRLRR
jgi:hypothetical protein